jgi:ankyrin repeat protein
MNQSSSGDGDDDMERRFQRGLAEDGGPSEAVRRAILEHASRMAVEHANRRPQGRRPAALAARRRRTIFGALAAAVFAGLLVVPVLRAPVVREQSPVSLPPNPAASPMPQQAPVQEPARELAEVQRTETPDRAAGAPREITAHAVKPKASAGPTSTLSGNASQAKTGIPTATDAAAAPPAAPAGVQASASDAASATARAPGSANRSLARVATSPGDRGELLRGAAASGDLAAVHSLLGSSFDVDARDRNGRTALMLAIAQGHADIVDALLAHGADANAADAGGVRPLQMAGAQGNKRIIDSLLRAGAY